MLENLTNAFSISFAKVHALVEALVTSRQRESTAFLLRLPLGGTCLPLGVPLAVVSGKGSGPVTTEKLQKHKDEVEAEDAGAQETGDPTEDPNTGRSGYGGLYWNALIAPL